MKSKYYKNWECFTGSGGNLKTGDNYYIRRNGYNQIDIIRVYFLSKINGTESWLVERANELDLSFLDDFNKINELIKCYEVKKWHELPEISKIWMYFRYYGVNFDSEQVYYDFQKVLDQFEYESIRKENEKFIVIKSI